MNVPARHPSELEWRRLTSGSLAPCEERRLVLHAVSGCDRCRRTLSEIFEGRPHAGDPDGESSSACVEPPDLEACARAFEDRESRAESRLAQILECDPGQRMLLIRNDARYQTPNLCRKVADAGYALRFDDPQAYHDLAEAAVAISDRMNVEDASRELIADLRAGALASLGNALRIQSDFKGAEVCLVESLEVLKNGTRDPIEKGTILRFVAALRFNQERWNESIGLARQAFRAHRSVDDSLGMARACLQEAAALDLADRGAEALEVLDRADPWIDARIDPHLDLGVRQVRVGILRRLGRTEEAMTRFEGLRDRFEELGDRVNLARMDWLEGEIARDLGRNDRAETAFNRALDSFLRYGMPFPAALVCIELATLLLEQARLVEVQSLAASTLPVFETLEMPADAMAAMVLFAEAARRRAITLRLLGEIATSLEAAQKVDGKR